MAPRWLVFLFSFVAVFAFSNCISFTTLQTPETLPPGKVNLGVGAGFAGGGGALLEAGGRVGVAANFDIGAKVALPRLIFADAKYQITNDPVIVSADFGVSYIKTSDDEDLVDSRTYGFYPAILVGGRHWYVGGKGIYLQTVGELDIFGRVTFRGSGWFGPAAVAGGWIGNDDIRLLGEVNTLFPQGGDPFVVFGLGVQFIL